MFARCYFNGTGATGAKTVNKELNVSGISKTGTGDYTFTFREGWEGVKNPIVGLNAAGIWSKFAETNTTLRIKTWAADGTTATDFGQITLTVFQ